MISFQKTLPPGDSPFNALWLGLWALLLAIGWLLPNHYPPWPNFHSDLWIAGLTAFAGIAIAWKSKTVAWSWLTAVAAALVLVPFLQFVAGLLPFAGQAWTPVAYLLGFLLALITGGQWERLAPRQPVDGLFIAIGAAAIGSVGIQLYQWAVAAGLSIWVLPSYTVRPHANFGQPNLLATFVMWGLIACAWGVSRKQIRPAVALLMAAYLLFGVALTQSRTALVAICAIVMACWFWPPLRLRRSVSWAITGLAAYFLCCLLGIDSINALLYLDSDTTNLLEKTRNESRLIAYRLFAGAALQSPWWGYGWTELGGVQLAVAQDYPSLGGLFFHSHNLFLDLLLWCGIPLGGLIIVLGIAWFAGTARRVRTTDEALLVVFIAAVGWHGMTELPLHYASFLLPTGLIAGVLHAHNDVTWRHSSKWPLLFILGVAIAMLVALTRDYFRVEANFYALRFEKARISQKPPLAPPEVLLLTQLREYIRLARFEARAGMTKQELDWVRTAATAQPSEASLFTLIMALALNNEVEEARAWTIKVSKVTAPEIYAHLKLVWAYEASRAPQLLAVKWAD